MATARDRINRALRLIGALASGETASASELADGIVAFNGMLDAWDADGLMIPTIVREEFALVPGTASYTLGATGATFTTSRPLKIERAAIEIQAAEPYEEPLDLLTAYDWAAIPDKAFQSSLPSGLFAQGTNPNETVYLWPVPSVAENLVLYSQKPLTSIANASDEVTLPPGGADTVDFNLALRLAPEFGKSASAEVIQTANETKGNLMRMNFKPQLLDCDAALVSRGTTHNINIGR